jgi:KDO2-lipid IV(A) lauroyltransferase
VSVARRAKRALEQAGFRLLAGVARALPGAAALRLGAACGRAAFALGLRRRVAVENVAARLAPAGGRSEAARIARESYVVAGRTLVSLIRADRISDAELWAVVPREEIESLRDSFGARGSVLLSGHFGNWELLVLAVRRVGVPLATLAGDQANSAVDEAIRGIRTRAGLHPLSARTGLRDALAMLRSGGCVASLADQDARSRGIFVDFLGAPASAHVGMASMARRAGVPIASAVLVDLGGRYRCVQGPMWTPDAGAGEEENERAGAACLHRFLEEQIRRHPTNYFWAHRRWKTRPDTPAGTSP